MFPPQERIDKPSHQAEMRTAENSWGRAANAAPATGTVSNRTCGDSAPEHGRFYSTTHFNVYTASGGEGRQSGTLAALRALPHSQLCSRVDEREQTFIDICESTPQFSALHKTHCGGGGACWQGPGGRRMLANASGRLKVCVAFAPLLLECLERLEIKTYTLVGDRNSQVTQWRGRGVRSVQVHLRDQR